MSFLSVDFRFVKDNYNLRHHIKKNQYVVKKGLYSHYLGKFAV